LRLDDRFMTIITAIVLIVAVGALVQGNGDGESILGPSKKYTAVEDAYIIPTGKVQQLDVLSNDHNVDRIERADLVIVDAPICGSARQFDGKIEFVGQASCAGTVAFTYCVSTVEECEPAIVTLDIRDVNAPAQAIAVAPKSQETEIASKEAEIVEEEVAQTTETDAEQAQPVEVAETPAVDEVVEEVAEATDPAAGENAAEEVAAAEEEDELDVASIPQVAFQPEPMSTPSNDDIKEPDEAVAEIRNVPDSAPNVDVAVNLDSNENISTAPAAAAPVEVGSLEMAAPSIGSQENDIQVANAASAPQVNQTPGGLTAVAEELTAGPAPDAQLQVSEQASMEPPVESSGILASIVQSNTLLGATFSVAKSLLEPNSTTDPVSAAQPVSAPGQTQATIIDSSELFSEVGNDDANIPLPQIDQEHTPSARPEIEVALNTPATLSIDTTPAAPPVYPEPKLVEEPEEDQPAIQFLTIDETPKEEVATVTPAPSSSGDEPALIFIEPIETESQPAQSANIETALADPAQGIDAQSDATGGTCETLYALDAVTGAEIVVSISAPCRAGQLFRITHETLEFNAVLDQYGEASISFPAFAENAVVEVTFVDGATMEEHVRVGSLDRFNRVAIVWDSPVDLNLHAYEYGAAENSDGHIWSGNPHDFRTARRSGSGYLVTLGLDPLLAGPKAEVYSVPVSALTRDGVIELSVEVADQGDVCNQPVTIHSMRTVGANLSLDRNVELAVGDCGTDNRIVVEDAIPDLRIARN
jgi:hypothetical protein